MSFRQTAIDGVKWTGVAAVFTSAVKLVQFAILAHYLSKSDFGLMAIVGTVIGFSALFIDFGINAAIIHKQDISKNQLSSLYWLNIFVSLFIFALLYGLAPVVAAFYSEQELIPIVRILAATFIITGLGNQYAVLLQKELKFKALAFINISAVIIGFLVALYLAIKGYGVYSLVYATLVTYGINAGLNVLIGRRIHQPDFLFSYEDIQSMLSFGFFQMGERSVNYLNSQFDILLIGKLFGTEVLGVYSIAKNISTKPYQVINPIVTKVTFPIMSKIQKETYRLRQLFLNVINYLCSINFPIYILVIFLAEDIVVNLFGEKWMDAVLILQILAFYRMFTSFGNSVGSLQLAKGRADLGFYWNVALFIFIPLVIYGGSHWGVIGVASSLLLLQIVLFYPAWYFLVKELSGVKFSEYIQTIGKPFFIALTGGVLGFFIVKLMGIDFYLWKFIVQAAAMGGVVYVLNKKFNRNFYDILYSFMSHE